MVLPLDPMTSPVKVIWPDGHTCIIGPWALARNGIDSLLSFLGLARVLFLRLFLALCRFGERLHLRLPEEENDQVHGNIQDDGDQEEISPLEQSPLKQTEK